jgi:hypothetical protein
MHGSGGFLAGHHRAGVANGVQREDVVASRPPYPVIWCLIVKKTDGGNQTERDREEEGRLRESLGEKTQLLNERIERELRRHLPPYVSVLGNLQFEQGSLAVLGTVTLLSWAVGRDARECDRAIRCADAFLARPSSLRESPLARRPAGRWESAG